MKLNKICNEKFINILLDKLRTPSLRSVYMNAFPGVSVNKLDIEYINAISEGFSQKFLTSLLTLSKFNVDFSIIDNIPPSLSKLLELNKDKISESLNLKSTDSKLKIKNKTNNELNTLLQLIKLNYQDKNGVLKRLNSILYEKNDDFQEHGIETFGFGYPTINIKTIDSKGKNIIIQAPLIIWQLELSKVNNGKNKYRISKSEDMNISINEALISYINQNFQFNIKSLDEYGNLDNIINIENINNIIADIFSKFNSKFEIKNSILSQKIINKKELGYLEINKPDLHWGGVFGIFRANKESIIKDTENILKNKFDDNIEKIEYKHTFSMMPTDPTQQKILDSLNSEGLIIQGPPGTGKSQTITALISTALDNNKKCLVICEKKTALDVIYKNLGKIGLDKYAIVIDDVNSDRMKIVDFVRDEFLKHQKYEHILLNNNDGYEKIIKDKKDLIIKINSFKKILNENNFFNSEFKNWKSIVGLYIKETKKIKINEKIFDELLLTYSLDEFIQKRDFIKSLGNFNISDIYKNNLRYFKDDIFNENNLLDAKDIITNTLSELNNSVQLITPLIVNFESEIADFYNKINKELQIIISNNSSKIEKINKNISKIFNIYNIGEKDLNIVNNIISSINAQNALLINDFNDILNNYKGMEDVFTQGVISNIYKNINDIKVNLDRLDVLYSKYIKLHSEYTNLINIFNEVMHRDKDIDIYLFDNLIEIKGFFIKKHRMALRKKAQLKKELNNINNFININNIQIKLFEYPKGIDGLNKIIIENTEVLGLVLDNTGFNIGYNEVAYKNIVNACDILQNKISLINNHRTNINGKLELFTKKISIDDNLFIDREQYINNIKKLSKAISQISVIDFNNFYNAKKIYLKASNIDKSLIEVLIKNIPNQDEWGTSIYYIYFKRFARSIYGKNINSLIKDDAFINELKYLNNQISIAQSNIIQFNINKNRHNAISSFTGNINTLYNKKGTNGNRRNSLRKIIHTNFDLFTSFFPIILTNPSAGASILPLKNNMFDIILLDEASQLRIEETFSLLIRGKQKIISGDEHQMPPTSYFSGLNKSNTIDTDFGDDNIDDDIKIDYEKGTIEDLAYSESLLDFGTKIGFGQSMLEIHYRSKHPDLIEFSNYAFYKGKLKTVLLNNYKAIHFSNIQGIYDSNDNINIDEANKVIETLREILINIEHDKLPSIGIGTFNINQRNYILSLVNELKGENSDFGKKLNSYDYKNFFIKNLDTIQGDEMDIIIISTTFGIKKDGKFIRNYGVINQGDKGYRYLNVLITRAKSKMYVITSIPQSIYQSYEVEINKNGVLGKGSGLFHAFLSYCESIELGNIEKTESILNLLSNNINMNNYTFMGLAESPFEEEVYQYLTDIIDKDRIVLQYKLGGFRIDMVILDKDLTTPLIAIECDGATYHSSELDCSWDLFRQEQLEEFGLKFYRIWSTNWFEDLDREVKKLKTYIENEL